jgi:uncharacterized membrane protein
MFYGPFLFIYTLIGLVFLAAIIILVEIEVITYAFLVLGLPPRVAFFALFACLIGSYINIPLYTVTSGAKATALVVTNFGVVYRIPYEYARGRTTVAINVGGALVPILIALYALWKNPPAILPSIFGIAAVTYVTHQLAHPVRGVGIELPLFVPPLAAAFIAIVLGLLMNTPHRLHIIAYVSGVLGTLIGADLLNLGRIANLGAPVASIGGAGTFDGVFLTGLVAVLIAAIPFGGSPLHADDSG